MISGKGLEARFTSARAAIIVRDVRSASTVIPAPKDEADYNATLQSAVMVALCRDAGTLPGSYRAALDLWASSAGRIEQATLLNSTGDPARDKRIVAAPAFSMSCRRHRAWRSRPPCWSCRERERRSRAALRWQAGEHQSDDRIGETRDIASALDGWLSRSQTGPCQPFGLGGGGK
jgi:hypothetical protein